MVRGFVRGVIAGIVATAVEVLLTTVELRLLGRPPYDPPAMASRLSSRAGLRLSRVTVSAVGAVMRALYGPSWGIPAAGLAASPLPKPAAALLLGAAILGFELVLLPRVGATPPLRRWARRFLVAEVVNVGAYAVVATNVDRRLAA